MARKPGCAVDYDSRNHCQVLFQMYGSVWPKVLPYCLLNMAIAAIIELLYFYKGVDLTISDQTHAFMNMLVAFLIVNRVNISINRYNEARALLGVMFRETRELLQTMAVLTRKMQTTADKEWRNETAYRVLLLLRTVMAVVDYRSDRIPAWEIPELDAEASAKLKQELYYNFEVLPQPFDTGKTEYGESMRVPVILAYWVRCCIDDAGDTLSGKMDELRSQKLRGSVDEFMAAYFAVRRFLTTPFPFPLVQMTRTFLFFYIFTVPFALLSDVTMPYGHLVVIFFLTYGFVGLEIVSVELDDPFGDDPNDFNNMAMAKSAYEDTLLLIMTVDGKEYMEKLRDRFQKPETAKFVASDEESWLLGKT